MTKDPYLIDIEHDCEKWNKEIPYNFTIVGTTVETVLKAHFIEKAEISLLLADDDRIRELNHKFRNKNKATNILAFPTKLKTVETMEEVLAEDDVPVLGDIIVAFGTASKEAKEAGIPLENHLRHLLVHGVLHLLGYDHIEDEDAELMEDVEIDILEALDVPNPYEQREEL